MRDIKVDALESNQSPEKVFSNKVARNWSIVSGRRGKNGFITPVESVGLRPISSIILRSTWLSVPFGRPHLKMMKAMKKFNNIAFNKLHWGRASKFHN